MIETIQSPRIALEHLMQDHWTEQETNNVKVVVDFFQHLMNDHDFTYTLEKFSGGSYIQHNRAIPNEITGLVEYVQGITKRFPDYSFDVKMIFADGDYVILHSHATMKAVHRADESKGFIITDTFKLKDSQLTEHWDAIQPIDTRTSLLFMLTGSKVANSNPTF